jgi:hypothetical protein
LVERVLAKYEVAGSRPACRTIIRGSDMSLKAFERIGKDRWREETDWLKHPKNPENAKKYRQEVKEMKKLAHRQERKEGKQKIKEILHCGKEED